MGLYMDNSETNTLNDSNFVWNYNKSVFINYGGANNSFIGNIFGKFNLTGSNPVTSSALWAEQAGGGINSLTWKGNIVVITDNTGSSGFDWNDKSSTVSSTGNSIDNNQYFNPYGGKPFRYCVNWNGGTLYDLAGWRTLTGWEKNSTFNQNGITSMNTPYYFANWTNSVHTYNLGTGIFKDTNGNTISGTFTVLPYQAKLLFWVSGSGFESGLYKQSFNSVSVAKKAVTNEPVKNSDLFIYPNPVSTILNIASSEVKSVKIFDMSGRLVSYHGKGTNYINVSNYPSGFYIVRVNLPDKSFSKKIIKR
jgi:hypothetical protein